MDFILANQDLYIFLYCVALMYINVDYLREFKKIQEGLKEISEEDIDMKTDSFSVLVFVLIFNFFRSWLIYIIAVMITDSVIVAIVSGIVIILGIYHSFMNFNQMKNSKLKLYLSIVDCIFIVLFLLYYFVMK